MLCILAVILSVWFARCGTHNLAIDLARVQYPNFIQPPPGTLSVVEDMVDQGICEANDYWGEES